jgi:capsular polysaccharide transport system ATP-binding protein
MIHLDSVCKTYQTRSGPRTVLDHVDLTVKAGQKLGILGRNGSGKSTLIRMISGAERPTSGRIRRDMSVSWPLAFGGAFQGSLTGLDNFKFICRIYGLDYRDKLDFVESFSELGSLLREPVKHYSSGMRARLAFAASLAVEFDCFLIDEVIAVGDLKFQEKCEEELFRKRADRGFILVSHNPFLLENHCTSGAVIRDGRLVSFESLQDASQYYESAA